MISHRNSRQIGKRLQNPTFWKNRKFQINSNPGEYFAPIRAHMSRGHVHTHTGTIIKSHQMRMRLLNYEPHLNPQAIHCPAPTYSTPKTTTTVTVETTTNNKTISTMMQKNTSDGARMGGKSNVEPRKNYENETSTKIPATEDQFENEKPITATTNADVGESTNINEKVDSKKTPINLKDCSLFNTF